MPKPNEGNQPSNDNVVEIKGKKFTVTPEFKKLLEEEKTELTTKTKTLETQTQTLSQRIAELSAKPPKHTQDDPPGGDDDESPIDVVELMDKPDAALSKVLRRELKKMGVKPSTGDDEEVDKKLELKLAQRQYWSDFYREHDYFDEETHGDVIKLMARKLLPQIKDLSPKESRKKIAEAMADFMGRKLRNGKLEFTTDSKHKPANGMHLESADGGVLDNDATTDDSNVTERTGSVTEILRQRAEARKKGGKK